MDPVRLHRVLLPPLGVERDRVPRTGLPARVPEPRDQRPGAVGNPPTGSTPTRCPSPPASNGPGGRTPTSPAHRATTTRNGGRCSELLRGHQGAGTNRRGCCRPTGPAPITGCAPTCAATPTATRWTWWWWAPAPAAASSPSDWPAPGGASSAWTPGRSGTRTPTGSATNAPPTPCTGPTPAQIGGKDPVPLGSNNSGRGVGGSMIHYAGYTPRFHPSDFHTRTADGVGADWPIGYPDLKPHYEQLEAELPVAGQDWPWGDPHRYPHHPHPVSGNGEIFLRGAAAAGITARVGPVAITNGRFGNRPHCIYRGFCLQGCKVNAKASPLITHIPDALAHGAEIRPDSHVSRVLVDDRTGRVTGVSYLRAGVRAPATGQGGRRRRVQHRNPPAAAAVGHPPVPGRAGQRPRPGRPVPDGAGRPADRGPVRRRDPDVQGTPAGGQQRTVLRNRPEQTLPTRLVHPNRQPAADHLGRTRHRARTLGRTLAGIHAGLRALGHPRRALRIPPRTPATGSPSPRRPTGTGCPSRTSPTPRPATTGC